MVKYFGVVVQVKGEGMITCKIEGDDGVVHTINIKKALYIYEALSYLLAPQKLA